MKYTLIQLIKLAREIEPLIIPLGFHCSIGGSCLHKGSSEKDFDIMLYPHQEDARDFTPVLVEIQKHFEDSECLLKPGSYHVFILKTSEGVRIDFMLLTKS